MGRWIKRIGVNVLVLLLFASVVGWWTIRQTKVVPEFYARATQVKPAGTEAASQQLEADVAKLQKDLAKPGAWEAIFSEDDINAWLIEQLPLKFRQLHAKGASDPRISIQNDHLLAAVRYKDTRIDTIISCELRVELTQEGNLLAVHITNLQAGALPLPLSRFMNEVSKEAAKGSIQIRWDMSENGPTALVQVPSEHPNYAHNPVIIESIRLIEGTIILSGHTGQRAQTCYEPQSPVYQFVTYRPTEKRKPQTERLSARPQSLSTAR